MEETKTFEQLSLADQALIDLQIIWDALQVKKGMNPLLLVKNRDPLQLASERIGDTLQAKREEWAPKIGELKVERQRLADFAHALGFGMGNLISPFHPHAQQPSPAGRGR